MVTKMLVPDRARHLGKRGRSYLLSALWPPERCFQILRVWFGMVGAAERFVTRFRPDARVFLFGHFHRSGVWERNGRLLCNTGAFMRGSRPLMVEVADGGVRIIQVEGGDLGYRAGEIRGKARLSEATGECGKRAE
jgi:hypothetical protein